MSARYAIVLVALNCSPAPVTPVAPPSRSRSVTVILDDRCSGVLAGYGLLLTANHCVEDVMETSFVAVDGQTYWADVHRRRELEDVAELLIQGPGPAVPPLTLAFPTPPEPAHIIHHLGGVWSIERTRVNALNRLWHEGQLADPPRRGMSGSGVFSQSSELLGILSSYGARYRQGYFGLVAGVTKEDS